MLGLSIAQLLLVQEHVRKRQCSTDCRQPQAFMTRLFDCPTFRGEQNEGKKNAYWYKHWH